MSILHKIFGGGHHNASSAANKYLSQIPDVGHEYYDPFIQQGQQAGQKAQGQYDALMNDPSGFINKLMEQYKTSEGYNFQKDQLTKDLGATAASGGIAGTPLDQMNQGQAIQGLLSKDQQQFLENALGVYGRGLTGQEGTATRGYDASGRMADLRGGALNQQGGLAFHDAQQRNQNQSELFQSLMQALGGGLGFGSQESGSLFGHKLWG